MLFQMTLRYLTSELRSFFFSFVLNNLNSLRLCHEWFSISYNFYMFSALSAVMISELNSVAGRMFCMSYKVPSFDRKITCLSQLITAFVDCLSVVCAFSFAS